MITIKEAAQKFGIHAHTIRFYEKEGLLVIPRNDKGIRNFDKKSMNALKAIVCYRTVGMSLDDIKMIFNNLHDHELSLELLKNTKKELDLRITELEDTRRYLINKIQSHETLVNQKKT